GIVAGARDSTGHLRITDLVEKPKSNPPSRLAIVGRYVLPPSIWGHLAATKPGAGGEIQLTDAMRALIATDGLYGVEVKGTRHDAGDKLGYLRANLAYALERPELRDAVRALCRELAG